MQLYLIVIDGFRGTISTYAVAKDSKGNYIYDETIAEAFHDCYLNGDNAKIASKLILEVLKEKLQEVLYEKNYFQFYCIYIFCKLC